MPVEKFRTLEEMNQARIRVSGNALDRFFRHCSRYRLLAKPQYPRGVFKFRTLEEAQAFRLRHSTKRQG